MGGERQVAHYRGVGVLVPTSQRGSESIDGEGSRSAVGTLEEFLILFQDD